MADTAEQVITKNKDFLLKLFALSVIAYLAYLLYNKYYKQETMYDVPYEELNKPVEPESEHQEVQVSSALGQSFSNNKPEFMGSAISFPTGGMDVLPTDLLPKSNVQGQIEGEQEVNELSARNYLVTSNNFGIDTVGSSNKNPNLQLRSDPHVPNNMNTGPWLQSSIQPNLYQRDFNIGS